MSFSGLRFLILSCFHMLVPSGRTARPTDSSDCSIVSSELDGFSAGTNTVSMSSTILKRLVYVSGIYYRQQNKI